MTLVASWITQEPGHLPMIWTAADSQISSDSDTLTLEGSKILELHLVCRDLTTPNQEVYYQSSLGFAYAGSSFTAFNTYSTLSVILANLGRSKVEGLLPSHESIIFKCKDILKHYTVDNSRIAEVCIWGFSPISKLPFIGIITPNKKTNEYKIEIQHGLTPNLQWLLLGNTEAKIKFEELMSKRLRDYEHIKNSDYWRSPFYPLREIIHSREFAGVGGNIQLSLTTIDKFQHTSILDPIDKEKNLWTMTFRNFDIDEDFGRNVGNVFISLNGMFMDFKQPTP